ncbi:GGDEF domain-containing protein [Paraburkholderia bryophila]|uniref:diguanylate cyclase n=1 Tax=Paraburkholderia bryophila TaxID=420952 RepID=A0A7Y9WHD6_9BURK|nr:GGDEF domain-containing protein [Paraburkholderia bryophila]NYH20889.1 diguanylate cyclase (GGDEF)-like protein [Paraburkholderia bryophila]
MSIADPLKLLSSRPDLRVIARLASLQMVSLALVALTAGTVLCAWLVPAVATLLPHGWSLMKVNTALCLLLGTGSLALSRNRQTARHLMVSRVLAGALLVIAGSVLLEHLTGTASGFDILLAADATSSRPGRMALQTSVFFLLLGLTLLFVRSRKSPISNMADALTLAMVVLTLVVLSGYCFGAARLFGESSDTRTSPHTLVCMALLVFVKIGRRAESGHFSVLLGIGIGSRIARSVLPFALLLPFLMVSGSAYTTRQGWLSASYAAALSASVISVALFGLVILMAGRINELERDLRDMSLTDDLTGILNRRGFNLLGEQAVLQARRDQSPLTVLFFDLDGLKQVNDSFGHEAGSQFLVDVATLLRNTFRGSDIVARIGGDEFAVVVHDGGAKAKVAMARMDESAAAMNRNGSRGYPISYSVGEASRELTGDDSFEQLVSRADAMMYEQKQSKRRLGRQRGTVGVIGV